MARIACPHDDELTAYLVGDLPTGRQDEIAEHVDSCTHCKPLLDQQWKTAKDDLTTALRQANRAEKAEIYSGEPELQQITALIEMILQDRPRGVSGGEQRGAPTTAATRGDPTVTSPILDQANPAGDVQRTESIHISNVYDRRTTAPLERPDEENRFTLSLKQPFNRWRDLKDAPTSNRVGFLLGWVLAIAGAAGVIAAICYFLF